jgi:isopenicillin N synthase-like dioxygenase
MDKAMEMHKKFFALSAEEKAVYRTTTTAGVGYGRLFEMEKDAKADWLDRINMWATPKEMKEKEPLNVQNPPGFK